VTTRMRRRAPDPGGRGGRARVAGAGERAGNGTDGAVDRLGAARTVSSRWGTMIQDAAFAHDSRTEAGRALSEQNLLLSDAAEITGIGHWRLEVDSGELHWSDNLFALHGLDPAQGTPSPEAALAFCHPDDRPLLEHHLRALARDGSGFELDLRLQRTDGALRSIVLRARAGYDAAGRVARLFGTVVDVTEGPEGEGAAGGTAGSLRAAMQHARMMVCHTDLDLRYTWVVNAPPAFAPDLMLGRRDDEFLPAEAAAPLLAQKEAVLGSGVGRRQEISLLTDAGRQTWDVSVDPLRTPWGAIIGLTVAAFEVTERKAHEVELRLANERLKQVNDDLEQFAFVAAHDLRAPLRGIQALAGWIADELQTRQTSETLDRRLRLLLGRVQRLDALLSDLLAYARSGHEAGPSEMVDTGALIGRLAEQLNPPPGFSIRGDGAMPCLYTQRTPLATVLRNLIANAIKHHDRDRGEILVSITSAGDRALVVVADDGPGIDPRFHERVFKMFTTLKPRDEVEGSGMGLAIVKRIVALRGGQIWVESAAGSRGARIGVVWPLRVPV